MLNQALFHELESYGLTEEHLKQLLAVCHRGFGKAIWYMDHDGIATVEFTVKASRNDGRGMRNLTTLLQKES